MAVYLAKIGFPMDSGFPRDVMTISPHYRGDNAQGLADALKTNLIANVSVGASTPFTVKVYNAEAPPPNYPLATATNGTGFKSTTTLRELALCLSYYSARNIPTQRGRLYIPHAFIGGAVQLRPTTTQMTNALGWHTTLFKSLPSGTIPVVYSRKLKADYAITDLWVDDEWDIVRSRGLKGTTRSTATMP